MRYTATVLPDRDGVTRVLRTTAVVAGLALCGIAPHLYYLTTVAFAQRLEQRFSVLGAERVLQAELASIGFVVLVAALVGSAFAERYELRGLGDLTSLREARWLILAVAPVLGLGSYLLFGRVIAERVPGYYPDSLGWALGRAIKGPLFDEVVARFGMMTIACGVVRRPWLANVVQAVFFTALALLGLSFFGLTLRWSGFFIASVLTTFGTHLLLGFVYARHGLLAAMAFHLVLSLVYPLHALWAG